MVGRFGALLAVAAAGCFDPRFAADLHCAATEPRCPSGYECRADLCVHEGSDGGPGADAADPGPDGDPPAGEIPVLSAGGRHTCAVWPDGAVRCWGDNADGQLGLGDTEDVGDDEPAAGGGEVVLGGAALQVEAGVFHTCALLDSGAVRCWGLGFNGQLGYGNTESIGDNEDPASAGDVEVGAATAAIDASDHSCAVLPSGALRCWGGNVLGELGYGTTSDVGDNEDPASAGDVDVGNLVLQVAGADVAHTCALLEDGAVSCWGSGASGRLGHGNTDDIGDNETPSTAGDVDLGGDAIAIAAGGNHTCALMATGAIRCWGSNQYGQLGYGDTEDIGDNEVPAAAGDVDLGGIPAVQIGAGYAHTCARLETRAVRCWGEGVRGALGYAGTADLLRPASADIDVGGTVRQLAVGSSHTCAVLDSGGVRCWGYNLYGQLGYGHTEDIGDDETPASAGDVPLR